MLTRQSLPFLISALNISKNDFCRKFRFSFLLSKQLVNEKPNTNQANSDRKATFHRCLHTSCRHLKEDRREKIISTPRRDEGVEGERAVDIDGRITKISMFPDDKTPDLLFDGVRFADLHICHIKSSRNNTILQVTNHKGEPLLLRSCGMEGFKHARKGTNIAAQATGISLGMKTVEKGIKNVRVKVQGLGPGRMASVKGLQMAGLNIVSITDNTPISWNPPRPRKQRRL